MKKIYIQPEVEFDEIEESLLYEPSVQFESTTPENVYTGPGKEEGSDDDDWFND